MHILLLYYMHLDIFDFDDTLCKSVSQINVTDKKTGKIFSLNSNEWKSHHYNKNLYDYDMSQFTTLGEHEPNWDILNIAKKSYANNGKNGLLILTARDNPTGVKEFLDLYNMPDVQVYAIGDAANKPPGKAKFIEKFIFDKDLTSLRYFDDSDIQIKWALALKKQYPNIDFKIYHIPA